MSQLKILQITKSLANGGAEKFLVELSNNDSLFGKLGAQSRQKIESMIAKDTYLETIRGVCNL